LTLAVPELSLPTTALQASFLEGMAEFAAEGRGSADDDSVLGSELRKLAATWRTEEGFAEYVAALRADALEETPRPAGWVPCTTWWWTDGDTWLGRIALRHRLTPRLLEIGGHIGYDVRRTARRRGYGSAMLAAVLPHARTLGITRLLVMCDVDNVGSRGVIEANGGWLEDERNGKARFWISTAAGPTRKVGPPGPAGVAELG
jgi:predicted acetyltransferase